MRYKWEIRTGGAILAGTDANVFLSLVGTLASMKEVELSDENTINDWEKNATNSGYIETQDLGEITGGVLRHDNWGAQSGWQVDWVRITNEEDGRQWTATVGQYDQGGNFPRLRFTLTDKGQYDQIQKQKAAEAQRKKDEEKEARRQRELEQQEKESANAEDDFERELERQSKDLEKEYRKAKLEADLAKKRAEIDKLRGGSGSTTTPTGGSGAGAFRTFELFGILNGTNVPLAQVVIADCSSGRYSVVPGGRVIVGEQPNEGYGLAGYPGRWQMYYPGRSPAEFGLDADKGVLGSDGSRGWVLNAQFLSQVFGTNWRAATAKPRPRRRRRTSKACCN